MARTSIPVLMTSREVAELLRLPESTVRYYIAQGQLASVRIGKHRRVRRADVLVFAQVAASDLEEPSAV